MPQNLCAQRKVTFSGLGIPPIDNIVNHSDNLVEIFLIFKLIVTYYWFSIEIIVLNRKKTDSTEIAFNEILQPKCTLVKRYIQEVKCPQLQNTIGPKTHTEATSLQILHSNNK